MPGLLGRILGLEGPARYASFLAGHSGRAEAGAEEAMTEIEKRAGKATAHFRR